MDVYCVLQVVAYAEARILVVDASSGTDCRIANAIKFVVMDFDSCWHVMMVIGKMGMAAPADVKSNQGGAVLVVHLQLLIVVPWHAQPLLSSTQEAKATYMGR